MKRIFAIFAAIGFIFACNKPVVEPVYDYFQVVTEDAELSLPALVEGEGVLEVVVKADYPAFDVNVDADWLTYVPATKAEADAVESTLKFTYSSNDLYEARTATITVTAEEKEIGKFVVTQAARKSDDIKVVWVYKVADQGKMEGLHPAVDAAGNVYVTETGTTSLYKILPDGTLGWKKDMVPSAESADPFSGQISVPSVEPDGSVVYAGGGSSSNGCYFAYNAADGSVKWEFSSDKFWAANNGIPAPKINRINAAIGKECIYIGNGGTTGTAVAINKETGARVSYVSSNAEGTGGPAGGCNTGMSLTKSGMVLFRAGYGAFSVSSAAMDKPGEGGFVPFAAQYRDKNMTTHNSNNACFTLDGKDHFAFFGATNAGMNVIWGPIKSDDVLASYQSDGTPSWTTHSIAGTQKQDQGGIVVGPRNELIVTLKNNTTVPGGVYAVDPATNTMAWKYDVGVDLAGTPAVDKAGNVHVIADNGMYYILKPDYEKKSAELLKSASLLELYASSMNHTWNEGDVCKAYGTVNIGLDGRMYCSVFYRDSAKQALLSAVFCLESGLCTGAGDTPWPLKHADCFNTGNQVK